MVATTTVVCGECGTEKKDASCACATCGPPGGDEAVSAFADRVEAAFQRKEAESALLWDESGTGFEEEAATRSCAACGSTADVKLRCSRCKRVWYCSAACQRTDWRAHRGGCDPGVAVARLDDFAYAAPTCGRCGAFAVGVDEAAGPWERYRACCGCYLCEGCERRGTGRSKEGPVPAAEDVCPRCGALPSASAQGALARVRSRADAGQQNARFVLGATLLRGLRGHKARTGKGRALLQQIVDEGNEEGAARTYFVGAANYEVAAAVAEKLVTPAVPVAPLLRTAAACGHAAALLRLARMYNDGDEVVKDRREYARLTELGANAGATAAKKALSRLYIDGDVLARDPEKAARLLGLDRTADMWKDGTGPRPPSFLFSSNADAPRDAAAAAAAAADGDGGEPASEWDEAEMDAFFSDDDD